MNINEDMRINPINAPNSSPKIKYCNGVYTRRYDKRLYAECTSIFNNKLSVLEYRIHRVIPIMQV